MNQDIDALIEQTKAISLESHSNSTVSIEARHFRSLEEATNYVGYLIVQHLPEQERTGHFNVLRGIHDAKHSDGDKIATLIRLRHYITGVRWQATQREYQNDFQTESVDPELDTLVQQLGQLQT